MATDAPREFIVQIDLRELAAASDRFLNLVVPDLAEETALGRYVREQLATGQWRQLCLVPQREDGLSRYRFDVYGTPLASGSAP
jgi:hypothetical protein